jgi:ABC-type nickel/cobalt efflux system permease component RcnA
MQISKLIITLCLSGCMFAGSALAAEVAPANTQPKLESISGNSADAQSAEDKCPAHQHKDKCEHKKGEPCPYHSKEHHAHEHDHCDYEKHGSKQ